MIGDHKIADVASQIVHLEILERGFGPFRRSAVGMRRPVQQPTKRAARQPFDVVGALLHFRLLNLQFAFEVGGIEPWRDKHLGH
jgi:hypothetical protein